MRELLVALAQAKDMTDVNIAAGLALEKLEEEDKPPGPELGQSPRPVPKRI